MIGPKPSLPNDSSQIDNQYRPSDPLSISHVKCNSNIRFGSQVTTVCLFLQFSFRVWEMGGVGGIVNPDFYRF